MRRASFKIQEVLDERQARKVMRERGRLGESWQGRRRLQNKSGCRNPFVPVQGDDAVSVTVSDAVEQSDGPGVESDGKVPNKSAMSFEEDKTEEVLMTKKQRKMGRARQYSVIMEEVEEERVGGRRDCKEEMMQPIKHLSGKRFHGLVASSCISNRDYDRGL